MNTRAAKSLHRARVSGRLRVRLPLAVRSYSVRSADKGIRLNKPRTKYQAWIQLDYQKTYLGTFATGVEAALAYDHAAKQMFGEFACLNFPDGVPAAVRHANQFGVGAMRDGAQAMRG